MQGCRVGPGQRYEKTQWYFQRYIQHLPGAGEIVLFDRSWYNRAGVEKVMGFATPEQVTAFLKQVPQFEKLLVDDGILLFNYWLCTDQAQQEERFQERHDDPLKTWKLSPQQPGGYRSAVVALDRLTFLAIGPTGEEVSDDQGAHWKHTDSLNLNAAALLDIETGWAVGPNGTIARFVNHFNYEIRYRHSRYKPRPATSALAD